MVTTSDLTGTCVNKTVIAIVDKCLTWCWLEPNHKSWMLVGLSRNLAKFVENLITWRWCGNIEDRERLSSGDEWRASVDIQVWNVQRWSWDVVQGCVQLRRLPARLLCWRPHGMAPVAGECTECTACVDVNMNVILIHIGLELIPSNKMSAIKLSY